MKIRALIKHFGLAVVALSVAIACSSTPTVQDTEASMSAAPAAKKGISNEAEGAVARAKAARYRVNGLGCKWADTGSLIEGAENQGKAGRNVKAISLANHAEESAVRALKECQKQEQKEEVVPTPTEAEEVTSDYTVTSGDTLWGIAEMDDIYADPYQWPLIYRSNSDQIEDADLIYPGQIFSIDHSATSAQVNAAITHAKNRGAWSVGTVEDSDRAYLGQ